MDPLELAGAAALSTDRKAVTAVCSIECEGSAESERERQAAGRH